MFFESTFSLFISFLVLAIGFFLSFPLSKTFNVRLNKAVLLYIWHTFFCLAFFVFSLSDMSDSFFYYIRAEEGFLPIRPGTYFVVNFVAILRIIGFDYLSCFLLFNIFGYVGLLTTYSCLYHASNDIRIYKILSFFICLLPSISFWSSSVGKDAISFMAVGLALWWASGNSRSLFFLLFATAIMFLVRPHVASIMVMAYFISVIFSNHSKLLTKVLLIILSAVVGVYIMSYVLQYTGVGNVENIEQYIDERQDKNTHGQGGLDITSMSMPMKLYSYMYRPLPFEAKNIPQLAASLDNTLMLVFSFLFLFYYFRGGSINGNKVFMIVYFLIIWIILAMTTANLGISMRQKWMFATFAIFCIFSFFSNRTHKRLSCEQ